MPVSAPTYHAPKKTGNRNHTPPDTRLSPSKRGYGRRWQRLRILVLQRDHYICQADGCGRPVGKSGHIDHITPLAQGGDNTMQNLQTLCHGCHNRKTASDGSVRR